MTPCEGKTELVEFWQDRVKCGDFGELTATSREMGRPQGFATFLILQANNGRSWARDWCGGDWMEFKGQKWNSDLASPDSKNSIAASQSAAMNQLWQRSLAESERQNQPLLWLRGSLAEWKSVLQSCAVIHYNKSPTDSYGSKIEPSEKTFHFYAWTPFQQTIMDGIDESDFWSMPVDWEPIFIQNFVPVGWDWECSNEDEKEQRSSWKVESHFFSTPIRLMLTPSQHELLEARSFLRNWLVGKVPTHQIKNLLE